MHWLSYTIVCLNQAGGEGSQFYQNHMDPQAEFRTSRQWKMNDQSHHKCPPWEIVLWHFFWENITDKNTEAQDCNLPYITQVVSKELELETSLFNSKAHAV